MALAIRLSRGGAKKRPYYRIVVADSRSPRDGRFIEKLGIYNPLLAKDSPERVKLDAERISHWLAVGAHETFVEQIAHAVTRVVIRDREAVHAFFPRSGDQVLRAAHAVAGKKRVAVQINVQRHEKS